MWRWLDIPASWLLYRAADLLFVVGYYLVRYRRKVVKNNLLRAFPDLPPAQRARIERRFYLFLADQVVEELMTVWLSPAALHRRIRLLNPEALESMRSHPHGTLMLFPHYGNIEWMTLLLDLLLPELPRYALYAPLTSAWADRIVQRNRAKWGKNMVPMQGGLRKVARYLDQPCLVHFATDQSPARSPQLYFTAFLGQATATHTTVAELAVRFPVKAFFAAIRCPARGCYTLELMLIPQEAIEGGVETFTDYHSSLLENLIREAPPFWLWSHRRWKHSPREGDVLGPALR